MMRRLSKIGLSAAVALLALAPGTEAQGSSTTAALPPLPPNDSIFRRARRLVSEGQGAPGRAIVDSLLRAAPEGTPPFGDALFWRGALAETAADAERDYRRVIVEYPLSPYSDDALLSLAELEQARGDRAAAYQHRQRFVREHPATRARARAGLAAARLAFEQHDASHGCAMIADARASAGASDVELRNQIEYYGGHCPAATGVASSSTAPPAAPPPTAGVTPVGTSRAATVQSAGAPTTPATRPTESSATRVSKAPVAPTPPAKVEESPPTVSSPREAATKPPGGSPA